jgi:hypothetical protein
LCAVAAVGLLIGHAVWLRRNDFVDGFVRMVDPPRAGVALAWVDWPSAVRALGAGRLPCSGSEAGLLRVAASIAEGIPVDLDEVVTGMDEHNLVLVARAVLVAGGHRGAADALVRVGRR